MRQSFQHTRANPDQALVFHHAAVHRGIVADGDPIADDDRIQLRWPCSTAQSCTLELAPTRIVFTSPRSTAFIHTEECAPSVTSPSTCAEKSM